MRAVLDGLHWSLVATAFTQSSDTAFRTLCEAAPTLRRFERAGEALAYLLSSDGDLDEKDRIYVELVAMYRDARVARPLAFGLLWGGLSPALDRIYRKHERIFGVDRGELPQEIYLAFLQVVAQLRLERVRFVAASITRNVDRDVGRNRRRQCRAFPADLASHLRNFVEEAQGTSPDGSALNLELLELLGDDATLVTAVVIGGHSVWEAAVELEMTYDTARQRLRRVVVLMRQYLYKEPPNDHWSKLTRSPVNCHSGRRVPARKKDSKKNVRL